MGWTQLKIIKEDCDPNVDNKTDLPNNCYLVTYKVDDMEHYDEIIAAKQSKNSMLIMISIEVIL